MVRVAGREYTRRELLRRVGSVAQIGGVRATVLDDGRARGARALQFSSAAGLEALILPDRGMDIAYLRWQGRPLAWVSADGLSAPTLYQQSGQGFLRSFFGGMLTTCGLINMGPEAQDQGTTYPMHGYLPGLPSSNVSWGERWDGDSCTLWARGVVRQWRLFGENLTLSREVRMALDGTAIAVDDVVCNESFSETPHMILYHSNAGFPLLDEGSRLVGRFASVVPRDAAAEPGQQNFDRYSAPQRGFAEQVYITAPEPGADGWSEVTLWNAALDGGLGLRLRWDAHTLPWLIIWKMMGESAYVLGMEPANCPTIEGLAAARKRGTLPMLAPGEARHYRLEYAVVTEMPAQSS